jgi:uncharacterized membrane protein (DUF4010 family)
MMSVEPMTFYRVAVALAIGLLIGVERGWKEREAREGERVAGVRTYGLIGLLGGVSALLADRLGTLALGLAFLALAAVLVTVHAVTLAREDDVGITSLVAGLATFVLGALAVAGEVAVAAASAVVITLLLSYKPTLHRWVRSLEGGELRAGLKLLLISVVLLPVLPDEGYGPWQALNPYSLWWMVVLIAGISFVGYFAIKIGGARRGVVFTGLFGGLASSTALTLHFSRLAKRNDRTSPILAVGVLLACGTMFPRLLLVVSVIQPGLLRPLLFPVGLMALLVYLSAFLCWRSQDREASEMDSPVKNPLELSAALTFGLLLAVILVLGRALESWFGDAGVLALAAASGVTDVDAIALSLARMSQDDLTLRVAALGVVIAASANSLAKGGMVAVIGGRRMGRRVALPLLGASVAGLVAAGWRLW